MMFTEGVRGGFGSLDLSPCTGCKGDGQETQHEKQMDPAGNSAVCLLLKVHQERNIFCGDNPQNHGEKQSPGGTHILNYGTMSCQGVYPNKRVLSLLLFQPYAACQRGHFLID